MKAVCLLVLALGLVLPASAETPEVVSDVTATPRGEVMLHLSFVTTASPEKLWRSLTAEIELVRWAAPKVLVELRQGGAYEFHFRPNQPRGRRGMEGTRILSYVPGKMLSYSTSPESWAVWTIDPAGDQQVLNFFMVGTGAEWNDTAEERLPGLVELMQKLAKYVQP